MLKRNTIRKGGTRNCEMVHLKGVQPRGGEKGITILTPERHEGEYMKHKEIIGGIRKPRRRNNRGGLAVSPSR